MDEKLPYSVFTKSQLTMLYYIKSIISEVGGGGWKGFFQHNLSIDILGIHNYLVGEMKQYAR